MKNSWAWGGLAAIGLLAMAAKPKPPEKKKKGPPAPGDFLSVPFSVDEILPEAKKAEPSSQTSSQPTPAPGPGEPFLNLPTTKPKTPRGPKKPKKQDAGRQPSADLKAKAAKIVAEIASEAQTTESQAKALAKQKDFPFSFESDRGPLLQADREYKAFLNGAPVTEAFPYVWFVGEDYEILKTSPSRWVLVDMAEKPLKDVLMSYAPSWATIKFVGAGLVIMVAPEALAAIGVEATGVFTALQLSKLAYSIASVIRAAEEGTGATVAEIAYQVYSIQSPGLSLGLGELIAFQLNAWGMKTVIKAVLPK